MRLRTLTIWKKLKPLWLGIALWACISIGMMLLWGYSILDFRGGLPDVEIASSQTIPTEKAHSVKRIDIHAEGVRVEIGSSYDIKDIKLQLYGSDYVNQKASWKLEEDGALQIRLDTYPVIANAYGARNEDALVLRILLPAKSYDVIQIHGKRLNTALYQCRGKQLLVDTAYGEIALHKANFQRASLKSDTSDISVQQSRVHYLQINTLSGDTFLFDNQLRYWNYESISGNLKVLTNKINGIWELSSERGTLYVGTRKWHQNLLMQLSSESGTIYASSNKKPWKETIPEALALSEDTHELILLEGRGENQLCMSTSSGDITVETVKYAR